MRLINSLEKVFPKGYQRFYKSTNLPNMKHLQKIPPLNHNSMILWFFSIYNNVTFFSGKKIIFSPSETHLEDKEIIQ